MNANEYQALAQRTVMSDIEQENKLVYSLKNEQPGLAHIVIAALKLNSESGELSDSLVKHLCYGQPLDKKNIVEECGDLLWYIALILNKLDTDMGICMAENLDKLHKRYPERFTEEHSKLRLDKQV